MKNTRIMAILAVFLVAVLCVGAVSAATEEVTVQIEDLEGNPTQEFTVGETIVVNISGTGNLDKINVTYAGNTLQNTTAITAAGSKIEFTAVADEDEVTIDNVTAPTDGGYKIKGGEALPKTYTLTINPVLLTVQIEDADGQTTTTFYDGQTIVVNISGTTIPNAKINVTYNDVTKQISEVDGFATVSFEAAADVTTITIENDKATEGMYSFTPATLSITVSDVSQLQVGTSCSNTSERLFPADRQ